MTPHVQFEVVGPEAVITLNRPEKRNAYDQEMIDAIAESLIMARDKSEVRVHISCGSWSGLFRWG